MPSSNAPGPRISTLTAPSARRPESRPRGWSGRLEFCRDSGRADAAVRADADVLRFDFDRDPATLTRARALYDATAPNLSSGCS